VAPVAWTRFHGGMEDIGDLWPLYGLRVRTGDVEMRYPDETELTALARLALEDIHDPETMPFLQAWTDTSPVERARSVLQWNWKMRGEWSAGSWHLPLVACREGRVVGTQGTAGKDFSTTREVETASWVGRRYQGAGIGTAMRRAVLHLAFAGLGAETARSGAFADNRASLRVSEKLGYVPDGTETHARRGQRGTVTRLVMSRSSWEERSSDWPEVAIEGLEPALWMFGLDGGAASISDEHAPASG
jgi:RimJ/RimL family protein N-acetyltransferase